MMLMKGISVKSDKDYCACCENESEFPETFGEQCVGSIKECNHHCNHWAEGDKCHFCGDEEVEKL